VSDPCFFLLTTYFHPPVHKVHFGQSLFGIRDMQNALARFRSLVEQDIQAIIAEMQPKVVATSRVVICAGEHTGRASAQYKLYS
jgi:hypothetical protein